MPTIDDPSVSELDSPSLTTYIPVREAGITMKIKAGNLVGGLRPTKLLSCTVATAPSAGNYVGHIIYVSNGAAGYPTVAVSDGSNWKRLDTLTNISAT